MLKFLIFSFLLLSSTLSFGQYYTLPLKPNQNITYLKIKSDEYIIWVDLQLVLNDYLEEDNIGITDYLKSLSVVELANLDLELQNRWGEYFSISEEIRFYLTEESTLVERISDAKFIGKISLKRTKELNSILDLENNVVLVSWRPFRTIGTPSF